MSKICNTKAKYFALLKTPHQIQHSNTISEIREQIRDFFIKYTEIQLIGPFTYKIKYWEEKKKALEQC